MPRPSVLAAAALVCAAAAPALAASTAKPAPEAPPPLTEGTLRTRDGGKVIDVPLEHTDVHLTARGHLVEVEVEQTFHNPYDHKIEAVYLFPLPTDAAVDAMDLDVGGKLIHGEIKERGAARATYMKAKRQGKVAALLTEERPNLFTQNVANIEPGARVKVKMRYLETLAWQDGGYELVFPMVAGPRYVPESSKAAADAPAVQPQVLPPGTRSSHDISLTADIDAGVAITKTSSSSHQIVLEQDPAAPTRTTVTLQPGDTVPNKDFVLRWDVAGDAPAVAVLAHRDGGDGSFFLTLMPPRDGSAAATQVTPREIVFVVDTSSSMRGAPLAKAKELVHAMLETLGADDTFQIVRFADAASALGEAPVANKPTNVKYALDWLDALEAGGATEMTSGITAALAFPHDPARLRLVVFLTDGYVGNEDEILASVHEQLGASRLFSFGVGTAVNRYLLEEMASFGRGELQVVRPDEDTAPAVARFKTRLDRPVLTDIAIDWGGLAVADATPAAIPDLFMGQPLTVAGHYGKGGTATVTVKGMMAGAPVSFTAQVTLPDSAKQPEIATVWARRRITELEREGIKKGEAATRAQILELALSNHLMSRYTAFVAVDDSRVTTGAEAQRVVVPVEVPDGLAYSGNYGYGGGSAVGTVGIGSYAVESLHGGVGGGIGYHEYAKSPDVIVASPEPPVGDLDRDETETRSSDKPVKKDAAPSDDSKLATTYEGAKKSKRKKAKGAYKYHLTVDGAGTVTNVTVEGAPSGGEDFAAEVADELRGTKLPSGSARELDRTYTFDQ